MAGSMFVRYGGFAKLSKVVLAFYDQVLGSDVVGPYFDGVDMCRLVDHQTKFIAQVMGGPAVYNDDALARLHSHLRIADHVFDEMAALLRDTLEDFEFAPRDIDHILGDIERRRPVIVGSPPAPAMATGGAAAS